RAGAGLRHHPGHRNLHQRLHRAGHHARARRAAARVEREGAEGLMKFFELVPKTNIDFLRYGTPCSIASAVVIGALFILWCFQGFNLSIEFRGGTGLTLNMPEAGADLDIGRLRTAMSDVGYPDATVVTFGNDNKSYLVTLDISEESGGSVNMP